MDTRAFELARLAEAAQRHGEGYRQARPYPHAVVDGLFSEATLRQVLAEFPPLGANPWQSTQHAAERKLSTPEEAHFGPATRRLFHELNSASFINFLEALTGISGIVPDPHLIGGGLHQTVRNGLLKVHVDFNRHPTLQLDRRLNVIVYLNEDWREEYGGHLEIWDREMKQSVERVLPIFNRCVVFSTSRHSFHGHPDPLTCPEGRSRKSLALYYYTNGRPAEDDPVEHGVVFRDRPGDRGAAIWRLRGAIQPWVPPALWSLASGLVRRSRRP